MSDMQWRTIESAPEGTMTLYCDLAAKEVRDWAFVDWMAGGKLMLHPKRKPTHWMSLPSPPSDNSDAQAGAMR